MCKIITSHQSTEVHGLKSLSCGNSHLHNKYYHRCQQLNWFPVWFFRGCSPPCDPRPWTNQLPDTWASSQCYCYQQCLYLKDLGESSATETFWIESKSLFVCGVAANSLLLLMLFFFFFFLWRSRLMWREAWLSRWATRLNVACWDLYWTSSRTTHLSESRSPKRSCTR